MGRMLRYGLERAREVGLGLGLFNELRDRWPDVTTGELGEAAHLIGQGIKAAMVARALGGNEQLALESIPVIPSVFFRGGEEERVIVFATAAFDVRSLVPPHEHIEFREWDVAVACPEGLTVGELMECIKAEFGEQGRFHSSDEQYDFYMEQIEIYYLGKRF